MDTAWECFYFNIFYRSDLTAFNYQFRQRHSTAEQCHAGLFLDFRQRAFVVAAEIYRSLYDFALARSTRTVPATVWKRKTFAKRCLQDSFTGFGEKDMSARLDSDLIGHGLRMRQQVNKMGGGKLIIL
jgi:hypothetical protein